VTEGENAGTSASGETVIPVMVAPGALLAIA
jgi:hypothetical protein